MQDISAASAYKQAAIENAPPIKIVRMLYDGAIRYVTLALRANPADPSSEFIEMVDSADAIVTELRVALDHSVGADVSQNLENLYLFCEGRFGQAQIERSHTPLEEVRRILMTLREGWIDIEVHQEPDA